MKRDYHGSCHCGAVKFRAAIDLEGGTLRCNCSICWKGRFWLAAVSPDDFELLEGEAALTTYQFGPHNIEHRFCATCGVKPFGRSAKAGFYAISVAALDDASPDELAAAPVIYVDGRADAFDRPPAVTSYL